MQHFFLFIGTGFFACISFPEEVLAWGPITHLFLGSLVLDHMYQLNEPVRILLCNQSFAFLYGCLSADIVLAKKLGRSITHCHRWDNGLQLVAKAETSRIQAFSLGYVSHLAADVLSHNCFVPSKTIESFDSGTLKHFYWEMLFDRKVTNPNTLQLLDRIMQMDFSDCNVHLENIISTRIFDFSFNKKVFDRMLFWQSLEHWRHWWATISNHCPWPLKDQEVKDFTDRSVFAMLSFLNEKENSRFLDGDPTGRIRLRSANKLRRHLRRRLLKEKPIPTALIRSTVQRFACEPFEFIETSQMS